MTENLTIGIISTMDTKGKECAYLKERIERKGYGTFIIDVGVMGDPQIPTDLTREEVARAGGRELGELREFLSPYDEGLILRETTGEPSVDRLPLELRSMVGQIAGNVLSLRREPEESLGESQDQGSVSKIPLIPKEKTMVTESGIRCPADVERLRRAGIDAFLVGEAFMRAPDPGAALRELFFAGSTP